MTEAEWYPCSDPQQMLPVLTGHAEGKHAGGVISARRLRLFAVVCARRAIETVRLPGLLPDALSMSMLSEVLDTAAWYTDGLATLENLDACRNLTAGYLAIAAVMAVNRCCWLDESPAYDFGSYARNTARLACQAFAERRLGDDIKEAQRQAYLLRELTGNPFRTPWKVLPEWLAWNRGTVRRIAEAIYADHDFSRMPVLADALEDCGCTDEYVLKHCRGFNPCGGCHFPYSEFGSGGGTYWCPDCGGSEHKPTANEEGDGWVKMKHQHLRGCWVADGLLGKR